MAQSVLRPKFFEGQVLAARDLNDTVSHSRDGRAHHDRYLHSWGIAEGLALEAAEQETEQGDKYFDMSIGLGVAIDGNGVQIVISEPIRLRESDFDESSVQSQDPEDLYPVFLETREQDAAPPTTLTGKCAQNEVTRVEEGAAIVFGPPGSERKLDLQESLAPGASGATGPSGHPWRILLGYVQWDTQIQDGKFVAHAESANGIGRRYAGVRAADVISTSGVLALRAGQPSARNSPAIIVDDEDGSMRFGLQKGDGDIQPVFTVKSNGDVTAEGEIKDGATAGVRIQTGIASDGMLLPLPPSISQEQVDDGKVILHMHVTPRYSADSMIMLPAECRVDGRRVICKVFRNIGGPMPIGGLCDYTITARTAAKEDAA